MSFTDVDASSGKASRLTAHATGRRIEAMRTSDAEGSSLPFRNDAAVASDSAAAAAVFRTKVRHHRGAPVEPPSAPASVSTIAAVPLRTLLTVAIPLVASFLLLICGIIAITVVNSHYAAEEAASFPQQLAVSMASFLRQEVEAELRHGRQSYKTVASLTRAGLADVPIEDYGAPLRVINADELDTAAFAAASGSGHGLPRAPLPHSPYRLDRVSAQRRDWHRLSGADSARWFGSQPQLRYAITYFSSHAQTGWARDGDGRVGCVLGITVRGEDVMRAEVDKSRLQFHIEAYRPATDVSWDAQFNASSVASSTEAYIVPHGTYTFRRTQLDDGWRLFTSEDAGFDYRGVPPKERNSKLFFSHVMFFMMGHDTYWLHARVMGAVRDPKGRLVGAVDAIVSIDGLQRSFARERPHCGAESQYDWVEAPLPHFINVCDVLRWLCGGEQQWGQHAGCYAH